MHQNLWMDDLISIFEIYLKEIAEEEQELLDYMQKYAHNQMYLMQIRQFIAKHFYYRNSIKKSFLLIEDNLPDLEVGDHTKIFELLEKTDLFFNEEFVGFIKPFRNINELNTFLDDKYEYFFKKETLSTDEEMSWFLLKNQILAKARIFGKKKLFFESVELFKSHVFYSPFFRQIGEQERIQTLKIFHYFLKDVKNYGKKKIEKEIEIEKGIEIEREKEKLDEDKSFYKDFKNLNGSNGNVKYGIYYFDDPYELPYFETDISYLKRYLTRCLLLKSAEKKPKEQDLDETKPKEQDLDETKPKEQDLDETKPKEQDLDETKPKEQDLDETKPKDQDIDSESEDQDIDSESEDQDIDSESEDQDIDSESEDQDLDEKKPEEQDINSESEDQDIDSESEDQDIDSESEDQDIDSESEDQDIDSESEDQDLDEKKPEEQDINSEFMLEDSESSEYMDETKPEDQDIDSESKDQDLDEKKPEDQDIDSESKDQDLDETKPEEQDIDSEFMLEDSESSESMDETKPVEDTNRWNSERFKHLWFLCDNCDTLIYKNFFLEQKGVCSECGATLQLTSSERIQLLIDHGTWRPMNMTLSSMDVLDKKHTTYDIKMVQKYSIVIYEGIYDFFFHNQFVKKKNVLKILAKYNSTLVEIVNVVLEKKFIKYMNLYSKKIINIIQDIIDTGLRTVQFVLFEIGKKIRIFFYWVQINKHLFNFKFLLKLTQKLANLKEKLLSQDKFLKIAAVFLKKIEVFFPEEKRKMRKIKKIFPFYPENDPETNYFLWLRKHTSICLMETYMVFQKWKYWFQNRCYGLLEEIYRFGSNILVEYVKKQDRYDCDNMMDHIMHSDDQLYCTNIRGLEYSREIEDFYLYYNKEKVEAPAWGRLWSFCLLQLMKDFSATTIRILDNKEKFQFCKKKEEYMEDTENIDEYIEEEYPLTYASLTKEEKEYIDASVELIKSTLNLGKDEFRDTEEEQCYNDYNISYQKETGVLDAIQTGIGKINGVTVALGVMDFQFMGGSMGSVVGEKISRLIQYATEHFLPLILVCASGGARMQEGSYSLMQMNKIAAVLHTHQKEKSLLYISVLTSPTTGGVTASFGMLGDVTIVEPNAYIAFAGKRVIEQTLNQIVDDEDQISDYLFDFGMFDSMVPRALLKNVLSEIMDLYMYKNSI
uniref:Acetyl-coenzyme A carboxylase carboxyl transferase subunit beta, chloroplastic n=1 Tax=Widdringtonia nodiflora TaxID=214229 RepID=A0A8F8SY02_9CONI|nr:acetyl-CoA carboxylase carboxyltransferase beta subunit [Widdringtonia nodiflora]